MTRTAMKTLLRSTVLAAALLCAAPARAQTSEWASYRPSQSLFLIGWGLAQSGNIDLYEAGTSTSGMSMEFRSMVKPRISVGLAFDYNRFTRTHSLEQMTTSSGGVLSASTFRYTDQFGVKATAHYYVMEGPLRPYLGVGIGGDWSYGYVQAADLANTKSNFNFIVTPELGLTYMVAQGASSVGLNLSVRYNWTNAAIPGVNQVQWWSEVIGLVAAY